MRSTCTQGVTEPDHGGSTGHTEGHFQSQGRISPQGSTKGYSVTNGVTVRGTASGFILTTAPPMIRPSSWNEGGSTRMGTGAPGVFSVQSDSPFFGNVKTGGRRWSSGFFSAACESNAWMAVLSSNAARNIFMGEKMHCFSHSFRATAFTMSRPRGARWQSATESACHSTAPRGNRHRARLRCRRIPRAFRR
jgi:hypothetical protein